MSVHYISMRLFLTISVGLLGAILLLFAFSRISPSAPFHSSANDSSSFGGGRNLLEDIFNQTLGVSTTHVSISRSPSHKDHRPLMSIQFQKIFVINLPARTDHRDSTSLAAALTDLRIDYIDGVTDVDNRTLPPGGKEANFASGVLGNWRAHMNIARM